MIFKLILLTGIFYMVFSLPMVRSLKKSLFYKLLKNLFVIDWKSTSSSAKFKRDSLSHTCRSKNWI